MRIKDERMYTRKVLALLKKRYMEDMRTSLNHNSAWELLVSTILSAQATDVSVNKITPALFKRYKDVGMFIELRPEDLYPYVRSISFYKNKSKSIIGCAKMIVESFGARVPKTIEELVRLPGVGRKTANVVLYNAYGISEGIAIDTHCITVANRLGLATTKNPIAIERDLTEIVDKKDWGDITHLFIALGRDVCTARRKYCESCVLNRICPSSTVPQKGG